MQASLRENKSLLEFIVNVSGGNVRVAIELISKFLGNPNIESEKIVKIFEQEGAYRIPIHEFSKVGLLGEYAHFQEEASLASNVFAVFHSDQREHFLSILLIGYLAWAPNVESAEDGFVNTAAIIKEMQNNKFALGQINYHLQRLTRKKLIESTGRRTFEDDEQSKGVEFPEAFRVTSLGVYHLRRWVSDFSFIETMVFDTPIFDAELRGRLSAQINDEKLFARYVRAKRFRAYLDGVWKGFDEKPYFSWPITRELGAESFSRVERYLIEHGHDVTIA
jgi:hypothetical protein